MSIWFMISESAKLLMAGFLSCNVQHIWQQPKFWVNYPTMKKTIWLFELACNNMWAGEFINFALNKVGLHKDSISSAESIAPDNLDQRSGAIRGGMV